MTTYKELKGTNIEVNSSDPSNPIEGQVWFNSTSNVLKGQRPSLVGSWSTGGNLNTARSELAAAGNATPGTTTSLVFGGEPSPGATANTEQYDGTSWTEVNNQNTARYGGGASGTSTAALAFGGEAPPNTANTEDWNGVSWVEVADLNTARADLSGTGTTTNSLAIGGTPSPNKALTEEWAGSTTVTKTVDAG